MHFFQSVFNIKYLYFSTIIAIGDKTKFTQNNGVVESLRGEKRSSFKEFLITFFQMLTTVYMKACQRKINFALFC